MKVVVNALFAAGFILTLPLAWPAYLIAAMSHESAVVTLGAMCVAEIVWLLFLRAVLT